MKGLELKLILTNHAKTRFKQRVGLDNIDDWLKEEVNECLIREFGKKIEIITNDGYELILNKSNFENTYFLKTILSEPHYKSYNKYINEFKERKLKFKIEYKLEE